LRKAGMCDHREDISKRVSEMSGKKNAFKDGIIISEKQLLEGNALVYDIGNGETLEISVIFAEKSAEVPRNQYTKWFDYDKILECLVIRYRKVGDYFTIHDGNGGSRHKSLKDYMIAEKIPKQKRDELPVIAVGNHVLWLVGYRISEYFKVSGNTNRILQVKLITKDCKGSGTEEKYV